MHDDGAAEEYGPTRYNPAAAAVCIEYDDGGTVRRFWAVPDCCEATTLEGAPAIRKADLGAILEAGPEALREAVRLLHIFPGSVARGLLRGAP